jgi:hypothetical protein
MAGLDNEAAGFGGDSTARSISAFWTGNEAARNECIARLHPSAMGPVAYPWSLPLQLSLRKQYAICMTANWTDLGPERSEYRNNDEDKTLIGLVVGRNNAFHARYFKRDGTRGHADRRHADHLPDIASAKRVVDSRGR